VPSINWDTVSTAGATALVVTLVVEYVAKPRLEARKEAILDALRSRREVQALVLRMTVAAQRYAEDMPDGVDRSCTRGGPRNATGNTRRWRSWC
jgi:hypothetical protein